jgi:thiosulfate/3-mercaptopyruvate sulfurtransferase
MFSLKQQIMVKLFCVLLKLSFPLRYSSTLLVRSKQLLSLNSSCPSSGGPLARDYLSHHLTKMNSFSSSTSLYESEIPSLIDASEAISLFQTRRSSIKFLDSSWHMNKDREPIEEFHQQRIVGARYFDIEEISDHSSALPHMVPSSEHFSEYMSGLGVSNSDHVIVYTQPGSFSAARCWWMLRLFGHEKVSILDGGIASWITLGAPTESGAVSSQPSVNEVVFNCSYNAKYIATWQQVLSIVNSGSAQIVDVRSRARFLAQAPEPRPGLPGGHIPGSLNLPFTDLLDANDVTKFRPVLQLKETVMHSGIIFGADLVFSCGSGVTAAVLYFSLHLLGIDMDKLALYDGSWTEWASRPDLPRVSSSKAEE